MPPDHDPVPLIETLIEDDRWRPESLAFDAAELAAVCFTSVTNHLEQLNLTAELTIVLSNDPYVQRLNRDYRGQDKPTNVLSFPADPVPGLPPEAQPCHLGDIILAYETLVREAAAADISLRDHAAHLMIHGILHLLGYDHQIEDEAAEMEQLEIVLLAQLEVPNPYEKTLPTNPNCSSREQDE